MRLGADTQAEPEQLIPVRMLNEFTYCPRLFHLEFVQGQFVDNAYTVEGRAAHKRVDAGGGKPTAPEEERPFTARSVSLSSSRLGLTAKLDLLEGDGERVTPVDYKRGSPPDVPERAWEPERVQLCAYGLLLREHGYRTDGGVLYFAGAKTRVEVPFTEELVARTLELLEQARQVAVVPTAPPPLVASSKCAGCSLNAICLPDETHLLLAEAMAEAPQLRQLVPARDDAAPLYVTEQGARVGISGGVLEVKGREGNKLATARLFEVSQVVLWGNVQVSAQAARELFARDVPIAWLSYGGWLAGLGDGLGHGNVELRRAQFRHAEDPERALVLARRFVRTKIANCRTLLRRNAGEDHPATLYELARLMEQAGSAGSPEQLLGIEGNAARLYFKALPSMLRPPDGEGADFDFEGRNRRPPRDPVNALLSLAYSLLAREVAVMCRLVGLDPFLGFYHRPRFGRPALALDVMEEFRPIVADSVVLTVVNGGVVTAADFVRGPVGTSLKPEGRKRFLQAWERRMGEEVTHPVFGYRISYHRVLEVQARLLGRYLTGELTRYPEFRTR